MSWDGQRLFKDLEEHGWTIYRIAKHFGRKWDTIARWRDNEPLFSEAQAIIELHAEVTRMNEVGHGRNE